LSSNLLSDVAVTASSGTQTLVENILHNPAGGLEQYEFGNSVITNITPDNRNRPGNRLIQIGSDDLVNESFGYDPFGNIDQIGSTTYIYDNLNRLTDVMGLSGRDFSYGYDSVGNIETVDKTGPVESASYTYANNQVAGLTYDPDGNLTDDGVNVYEYDGLGQTTSVTTAGGTISYVYDALGKRIVKSDLSGDVVYTYLGEQLLSEYDPTAGVYTDRVFMEGQLLARVIDDGVSVTNLSYAHLNHLGSPVAFTDGTAAVVWPEQVGGTPYEVHAYEPFGADFDDIGTPTVENKIRYTGKLFESETGKHYFNARYLNAVTDTASPELPPRFLGPDVVLGSPGNGQSWNRYTSMANNPVVYVDPDGKRTYYFAGLGGSTMDSRLSKNLDIRDVSYNFDFSTTIKGSVLHKLSSFGDVLREIHNKGSESSEKALLKILDDLERDPLKPGEKINMFAYSGGGQIAVNVAEMLTGLYSINNIIVVGAPINELSFSNIKNVYSYTDIADPLGWNIAFADNAHFVLAPTLSSHAYFESEKAFKELLSFTHTILADDVK